MKQITLFLIAIAAALPAQAHDGPVPPQEIQSQWVGKTIAVRSSRVGPLQLKLNADQTATVQGDTLSDEGTWRLWERGYCATWRKIRAGTETCLSVQRKGEKIEIVNPDGTLNATVLEIKS